MAKPNNNPTGINQYTKGRNFGGPQLGQVNAKLKPGSASLKPRTQLLLMGMKSQKLLSQKDRNEMAKMLRSYRKGSDPVTRLNSISRADIVARSKLRK